MYEPEMGFLNHLVAGNFSSPLVKDKRKNL